MPSFLFMSNLGYDMGALRHTFSTVAPIRQVPVCAKSHFAHWLCMYVLIPMAFGVFPRAFGVIPGAFGVISLIIIVLVGPFASISGPAGHAFRVGFG